MVEIKFERTVTSYSMGDKTGELLKALRNN